MKNVLFNLIKRWYLSFDHHYSLKLELTVDVKKAQQENTIASVDKIIKPF